MSHQCNACGGTDGLYYIYPTTHLGKHAWEGVLLCAKCQNYDADTLKELLGDAPVRSRRNSLRKGFRR